METLTYRQNPGIKPEIFVLESQFISVKLTSPSLEGRVDFMLSELNGDFEEARQSFPRFYVLPLVLAAVLAVVAIMYPVLFDDFRFFAVIGILTLGYHAYKGLKPRAGIMFRRNSGKPAFVIFKPDEYDPEYRVFCREIQRRITEAKAGAIQPTPVRCPPSNQE